MNDKRKIMVFFPLVAFFAIFLNSCASGSAGTASVPGESVPYVWLTNRFKFILLHPENIEKPLDGLQRITASFLEQEYQMLTWVKADETGINMSLLNEMGAGMGEISFSNGAISFSSAMLPEEMKPEYMIADFQLCFYSAASLEKALSDGRLLFEETSNGRRILDGNTVIIEINKNQNAIVFTNHLRGYVYTLEGDFI